MVTCGCCEGRKAELYKALIKWRRANFKIASHNPKLFYQNWIFGASKINSINHQLVHPGKWLFKVVSMDNKQFGFTHSNLVCWIACFQESHLFSPPHSLCIVIRALLCRYVYKYWLLILLANWGIFAKYFCQINFGLFAEVELNSLPFLILLEAASGLSDMIGADDGPSAPWCKHNPEY